MSAAEAVDLALAACAQMDGVAISAVLRASGTQTGLGVAITDVLMPALHRVGQAWATGSIDVAHEHLFSTIARRWLASTLFTMPPPPASPRVVLACGPTEHHDLALEALEVLLRLRGQPVTNLGPNTPATALLTAIDVLRPAAVVLSAQLRRSRSRTIDVLARAQDRGVRVFYGGAAFASQPTRLGVPGDYLGVDLTAAANQIICAAAASKSAA